MAINPDSFPQRAPEYRLEMLDGEALLFHPGERRLVHCNQTAALIWHLCDGQRNVQEIIALLAEAYPEAGSEMADDVQQVLAQFLEAHAIALV